ASTLESFSAPKVATDENAPVDLERFKELTDGSEAGMKELADMYLAQTAGQLQQLRTAITSQQHVDVRRAAHSCAGGSATCGMTKLVPHLRELERQGHEGKLTNAEALCAEAEREFESIQN